MLSYDELAGPFLHASLEVSSMAAIGGKLMGETPGGETNSAKKSYEEVTWCLGVIMGWQKSRARVAWVGVGCRMRKAA